MDREQTYSDLRLSLDLVDAKLEELESSLRRLGRAKSKNQLVHIAEQLKDLNADLTERFMELYDEESRSPLNGLKSNLERAWSDLQSGFKQAVSRFH